MYHSHNLDKLSAHLLEVLEPLGQVSARRMFGAVGLFHRTLMFGLVVREELFLKVGDQNRSVYEAAGEAPFSYATKHGSHTLQSYWRCPPDLLDDTDALHTWTRDAIAASIAADRNKRKPSFTRYVRSG